MPPKRKPHELADGLNALAHPSRLEIIQHLACNDKCCGNDFCDCMELAQSTISQHLDLLKQAGLVERRQDGTRSLYSLNRERLGELANALMALADGGACTTARSEKKS